MAPRDITFCKLTDANNPLIVGARKGGCSDCGGGGSDISGRTIRGDNCLSLCDVARLLSSTSYQLSSSSNLRHKRKQEIATITKTLIASSQYIFLLASSDEICTTNMND